MKLRREQDRIHVHFRNIKVKTKPKAKDTKVDTKHHIYHKFQISHGEPNLEYWHMLHTL